MFGKAWKWIVGVFRKRSAQPKPAKFSRDEGYKTHRWTLAIPGIDTYSIKSVKLPVVKPAARKGLNPVLSQMTFEVFANVASAVGQSVLEWFNQADRRRIELKYLTSHGKVAEKWTMLAAPVEFKTNDLDYATSNLVVVTIKVQPYSIDIRGYNVTE